MPGGSISGGLDQPSTIGEGYGDKTFSSADTAERVFATDQESGSVIIQAHPDNAGRIFLGFDNNVTSNNGFVLGAGDVLTIDLDVFVQPIWGIANNANDSLRFLATN